MGRTEVLHPRQAEIDRILLSTAGKRSGDAPRLLREAGIDPATLGIKGDHRDGARIAKLRNQAKARVAAPPAGIVEAAQEAARLAAEARSAELRWIHAKKLLEDAQRRLTEEAARLSNPPEPS